MQPVADPQVSPARPTVLVVDDDPVFRLVLEEVLRRRGAGAILQAADGEEAQAILARPDHGIDVVTLDLHMPKLDGVSFLRRLGERSFAGRLVLISGEHQQVVNSASRLATMLKLDCVAALRKPVDFEAVAAAAMSCGRMQGRAPAAPVAIAEVAAGLSQSRLLAHYQPRIDVATGAVTGAEALARMRGSTGALIDAGQMIDLAEASGRIVDLTWRMIERVTADAAELVRAVAQPMRLSFNISSTILADREFPRQLGEMVRRAGMRPDQFILELTESRIPADAAQALEALTILRMRGFELAIDDFGTGYSNIEQLRLFPITELKVDKSFMMAADSDGFARACVDASTALARELGLRVVAEGVETERELELARRYGMAQAQGYLFSRPLPFADFVEYVRASAPVGVARPERRAG